MHLMPTRLDLAHLYENPAQASFRVLQRALTERGWERARVRGSHYIYRKPGWPGPISLPRGIKGTGTIRKIIRQMQEEEQANG